MGYDFLLTKTLSQAVCVVRPLTQAARDFLADKLPMGDAIADFKMPVSEMQKFIAAAESAGLRVQVEY